MTNFCVSQLVLCLFSQYELQGDNDSAESKVKLSLGHILSTPKQVPDDKAVSVMRSELQQVATGMEKNHQKLKYLSLSFPKSHWQHGEIAHGLVDVFSPLNAFYSDSNTKIGLDLSTRLLLETSPTELAQVLGPLLRENLVEFVTLATNPMTATKAAAVQHELTQSYKVAPIVFGTEVLRLHPVKPGQISPNYNYKHPHHYRFTNPTSSGGPDASVAHLDDQTLSAKESDAVDDLRAALDRAVTIEKIFIDKVRRVCSRLEAGRALNGFLSICFFGRGTVQ